MNELVAQLVEIFVNFWLKLFLDGLFGFLTDVLFGGPLAG